MVIIVGLEAEKRTVAMGWVLYEWRWRSVWKFDSI